MKEMPFYFAPDEDLDQLRRLIQAQQAILEDLVTRLDRITDDHKNRQEKNYGLE